MPLVIQEPLTEEEIDVLLDVADRLKEERRKKEIDELTKRFWDWIERTKPEKTK